VQPFNLWIAEVGFDTGLIPLQPSVYLTLIHHSLVPLFSVRG